MILDGSETTSYKQQFAASSTTLTAKDFYQHIDQIQVSFSYLSRCFISDDVLYLIYYRVLRCAPYQINCSPSAGRIHNKLLN